MPLEPPEAGPSWAERAVLPGYASVLDPDDTTGRRSEWIDAIQRRALERVLKPHTARVLDFGCGTGRLTTWLAPRSTSAIGVDAEAAMLREAVRRVNGTQFCLADGARLPFRSDSFAVAVSVGVLQYFARDPRALADALAELARVLYPSGELVLVEQIRDGALARGAPLTEYTGAISAAGLDVTSTRVVRRSDAWTARAVNRLPITMQFGVSERIVMLESRLRRDRLTGTGYADALIVARKPRA